MKLNPCHYSCKCSKVVTGVVLATMSPMPKLVYRSHLREIRKFWNIKDIYIRVYLGENYVPSLSLMSVHIYSFMVSSCWGLNCGFSALPVTP